jgi:hypothetical protein
MLSVSDWPITMIGPGGLLLVVLPRICCCPSFMGGVAKKKSKQLNLDVKYNFAESHTENC